ncbi:MAG: class I SAM-dependent methyltransferase [Acidobacteria bacterium]|nr:class I SAM-dependent methyltransferase [Acidobacteriota bacterium]
MPAPPSPSSPLAPAEPSAEDVRRAADALAAGDARADTLFDHLLPPALRAVSDDYWTPAPVVRQVASWLREEGVGTIVDVGSGAGKFCVGLALLSGLRVIGLEQRPSLVTAARALTARFGLHDRVTFIEGAFGTVPTPAADAYYLFNPFNAYTIDSAEAASDDITFTRETWRRDVEAMTRFLAGLPVGAVVVTYNGFGRYPPRTFEQTRVDLSFRGPLRLWTKRAAPPRPRAVLRP